MDFAIHGVEDAPEGSRELLLGVQKTYGSIPNLYGAMSEAPTLVKAYLAMAELFGQTSLSPIERNIVLLTASYENGCEYCVAVHSLSAARAKATAQAIEAIRSGKAIDDPRLEALRRLTASIVSSRGWPPEEILEAFLRAGFTKAQVLEVLVGVGQKTLSNYTNHLASTPLDPAFASAAWRKPDSVTNLSKLKRARSGRA